MSFVSTHARFAGGTCAMNLLRISCLFCSSLVGKPAAFWRWSNCTGARERLSHALRGVPSSSPPWRASRRPGPTAWNPPDESSWCRSRGHPARRLRGVHTHTDSAHLHNTLPPAHAVDLVEVDHARLLATRHVLCARLGVETHNTPHTDGPRAVIKIHNLAQLALRAWVSVPASINLDAR